MYSWPDYYGYDPVLLQQYGYGYGYPGDMAAQQFGFRRGFFWPWFFFLPFFFRRRWWW